MRCHAALVATACTGVISFQRGLVLELRYWKEIRREAQPP